MYGKLLNSPLPPPIVVGKFRLVYCTRYCHGCWYNVWKRLKRALLCLQIPHINQPDLRALLCRFPMSISLTWEPCFADSPCQSAWLESPALFADSPCQSAWLEPCFVCRFPMSISLTWALLCLQMPHVNQPDSRALLCLQIPHINYPDLRALFCLQIPRIKQALTPKVKQLLKYHHHSLTFTLFNTCTWASGFRFFTCPDQYILPAHHTQMCVNS